MHKILLETDEEAAMEYFDWIEPDTTLFDRVEQVVILGSRLSHWNMCGAH